MSFFPLSFSLPLPHLLLPLLSPTTPSFIGSLHACMLILRRQIQFHPSRATISSQLFSMKPWILYIQYYEPEIMQCELHIWSQIVAVLLPKLFPLISKFIWVSPVVAWMCLPFLAVPEGALIEVGEIWAAVLPSPEQQLSSPPNHLLP